MKLKQCLVALLVAVPVWAMAQTNLVGQWVMPVPNNAQCSEYYRFTEGGEFHVNSAQEQVSGRYGVKETAGLPQLDVVFTADNGMMDCFGNAQDQTGISDTHFLKWESENHVRFCSDVLGQNCPVGLHRQ